MPYHFQFAQYDKPTVGLYIHIPFCVKKCDYCDFYSVANATQRERDSFQTALRDWLVWWSREAKDRVVDTVYIGGGTPSCYDANQLAEIIGLVRVLYPLAPDCEITVECNPDSATQPWLTAMKKAGVNRLSMGVQSANDDELCAVGRLHDFATAQKAFRLARTVGFDNISLDLIYGLPGQTMASWQRSVEVLIELGPEHLSCYGLKVEEGTPLYEHQKELTMADDDTQADMYLWLVERLERAGYGQYEISNFAMPGKHSRHNMRYWLGQEYIGIGPSAHSYFDGRRDSIVRNLNDFCRGVCAPRRFRDESRRVDAKERVREYILLHLRTTWGISAGEYEARYGFAFTPLETKLKEFERYDWAVQENGRWRFTPKGFLVSNALIGQLLDVQETYLSE